MHNNQPSKSPLTPDFHVCSGCGVCYPKHLLRCKWCKTERESGAARPKVVEFVVGLASMFGGLAGCFIVMWPFVTGASTALDNEGMIGAFALVAVLGSIIVRLWFGEE